MKATIDATVIKQGQFTLTFHPHRWIKPEQVVELIDHATNKYGKRVKFLNFHDIHQRLVANLTAGQPLRNSRGGDNGVRLLDVNADGFMDVVIGNDELRQTRIWQPEKKRWHQCTFPVKLVSGTPGADEPAPAGVRFGVLQEGGRASVLVRDGQTSGLWHFNGRQWVKDKGGLAGLAIEGRPVQTAAGGRDMGVRLVDLNGDEVCELIVSSPAQNAVFQWRGGGEGWNRLPAPLPEGTSIVTGEGTDAGLRLVDIDDDGRPDVVFSDHQRYSVHLFRSLEEGWSRTTLTGVRDKALGAGNDGSSDVSSSSDGPSSMPELPPIVLADGSLGGVWFKEGHLWVQNEYTGKREPFHVESRPYTALIGAADKQP